MSKTNPFAGLMAGFRGARAEDEKPEDEAARAARRAEEDKAREDEDARRAEEDQRRQDEDARRAEEDGSSDPANSAEEDDQDPEADAGDDDNVGDDKESKAFRRGLALGRARENARSARIFLAAAKVGRPDLAATLAFTTRNTSAEAGRLLNASGSAPRPRGRLDDRMADRRDPRPGAGSPGGNAKPSFGERVAIAVKKAGR